MTLADADAALRHIHATRGAPLLTVTIYECGYVIDCHAETWMSDDVIPVAALVEEVAHKLKRVPRSLTG